MRRQWHPTPVLLPGKSHGWGSPVGCSPWGCGVRHDWATSLSLFTFMRWRRKWQPTPVFLPGESRGRGSLVGCRLWGHTESDMTEATQQQQQQQQLDIFPINKVFETLLGHVLGCPFLVSPIFCPSSFPACLFWTSSSSISLAESAEQAIQLCKINCLYVYVYTHIHICIHKIKIKIWIIPFVPFLSAL